MPRISLTPNPEDLLLLVMMLIGIIIVVHTILSALTNQPPSNPTTMVIPKLMPISLIAP